MSHHLYLCGSVVGRSTKEILGERLSAIAAIREQGWTSIDPLFGEYASLKGKRSIQDDQVGLTPANIVLKDKYSIDQADILLWLTANIASFGSCIEVGYAWAKGVSIIAIDPTGRGRESAFVLHISTFIGDTLEECLEFVARYMTIPEPAGDEDKSND